MGTKAQVPGAGMWEGHCGTPEAGKGPRFPCLDLAPWCWETRGAPCHQDGPFCQWGKGTGADGGTPGGSSQV